MNQNRSGQSTFNKRDAVIEMTKEIISCQIGNWTSEDILKCLIIVYTLWTNKAYRQRIYLESCHLLSREMYQEADKNQGSECNQYFSL